MMNQIWKWMIELLEWVISLALVYIIICLILLWKGMK